MRRVVVLLTVAALAAWCASPASALPINVARQGTATQSTLASGGVPERAIDGGLGRSWGLDATTTHTNGGVAFNSWEVDLGGTYDISQIDLHNRGDCCTPNRLGDFRVNVLDAPGGSVVYSEHFPGDVGIGNMASFSPPAGTMGQVVQVQIVGENGGANDGWNNAGNGVLSLREVVVLGDADVPNGINLAANYGVAEQISTLNNSHRPAAHRAIDGNTSGVFNNNTVTHTNGNNTAWWEVDLTATANLDHITVFERTDSCCSGRLTNFTVSVLDETMAVVYSESIADVATRADIALPYGTEGRHVRVQMDDTGTSRTLELAEVQAVGGANPNLARNPRAAASQSTIASGGVPERAIDGNTNGNWAAGSVTHTDTSTPDNWWQVELGSDMPIEDVVLYNRADCCGGRLSNFRLSVFDGAEEVYGQNLFVGNGSVPQGGDLRVPIPEGTVGDRVRVQLLGLNNDGGGQVSLAEAQVWGQEQQRAIGVRYTDIVNADAPVGYWRLGESSTASAAVDQAGTKNGAYTGGVTVGEPGAIAGDTDTAARFDGSSGRVAIGTSPALNSSGQITYEAWIQPEASSGLQDIVVHGYQTGTGSAEGYLRMNGSTYQVGRWPNEATASAPGAADVSSGEWVHLVGTYDGNRWELYRNGLRVGASAPTANGAIAFAPDSVGWAIAGRDATSDLRLFTGLVDEAALYDHALTPDQISRHYQLGSREALPAFSAEGSTNVAPVTGTATQSSDYSGSYPAVRAIDDNLGNFSHTLAGDTPATWEVDLHTAVPLEKLVLHNRDDGWQHRLRDITVQIFDPTGTTEVFNSGLINPENVMNGPAEIELDLRALTGAPVSGGLVRVTRTPDPDFSGGGSAPDDSDVLTLGEVQAFSNRRYKNIAIGGGALQSSQLGGYAATLAIDGDLGNFTHTTNTDTDPTMEIDLGATFQLETLTLHNRDSCCQARLRDVTVEVLGSDGSVAYTSPLLNPGNAMGGPATIPLDLKGLTGGAVEGRFLRITRTSDPTGGADSYDANVLSLGEVQAYSSFAITGDTAPGGIDKTGLLYHLDAGKGVVTTGGNVATWTDQSGNANDFVQAAVAKQPELVPNAINGQPVVRFDGDNSSNAAADELVLGTSTTPRTVIILNNTTQYTSLDGIWGVENGDLGLRQYPSGQWRYPGNVGDFASTAGSVMFIDGVMTNAFTLDTPHMLGAVRASSPATFSRTSLGQYFIDGHGAGVRAWEGDIGEVIVFDRVLNQAELAMVGNYLSAKYAVPIGPADLYRGDEPAQGNYDHDVFGIGQVDAANKVTAAGSAGLGLMVENGSLGNGDFLLAGHAQPNNSIVDTQLSGFAASRWDRAWFLDKTGDLDALLTFDFGDAGLPFLGLPLDDAYQFALLYAEELGADFEVLDFSNWTLNGDQVSFALPGALISDGYYTLGTAFVPEPATLSLLALGGLALLRRRRRQAAR